MAGLRKWLRNKLETKPNKEGTKRQADLSASLPTLQRTRSRPFTPTAPEASHLENYGYFSRLPYEIRRQILIEAFGGRRVHTDLSFRHPLKRQTASSSSDTAVNGNGTRRHCGLGMELVPDESQPEQWQWFGCVCHRRAGYSEVEKERRYAAMEVVQTIEPCDDTCLEGSEAMCSCPGGEGNDGDCFVGAMGWLLTCWQAYTEGTDVLYSTNAFHISSLDLQLHLPRLIPTHHLERITSLELLWKLNFFHPRGSTAAPVANHIKALWSRHGDSSITSRDSPLHALCELIPQMFPRLQRLYISYQCWLESGCPLEGDLISVAETAFLGPVEDMLRSYRGRRQEGSGLELNVAIQHGAWRVMLAKYRTLLGSELRVESADRLARGRFWKPLDDNGFGYWICCGWEDTKAFGLDYWFMSNWGNKWTEVKDIF